MIAFRMLVESLQGAFLPGGDPEAYEALSAALRFALPAAGGLVVGVAFQLMPREARDVRPAHVLERLQRGGARLPFANALAQFGGAALSIVAGHSVGREGPAIHLGASVGSLGGRYFELPEGSLRVMAAGGVAAAIAASFNTPLAGVVFAMEVMAVGYSVMGFAPVILAAVSATALNRLVYGADPAFAVPALVAGAWLAPQLASSSGFYALLGMGAMMGGTLHAPLAALTAMLELTGNPNILWPGMLAVIAAYFTSRQLFRRAPVFEALLKARAPAQGEADAAPSRARSARGS